jgi:subtilisin family serine protease
LAPVALLVCGCGSAHNTTVTDGAVEAGSSPDAVLSQSLAGLPSGAAIPGRYIVVLKEGVSPEAVASGHGMRPERAFAHALRGFAGPGSAAQVAALRSDSRVRWVEPDRVISLADTLRLVGSRNATPGTGETLPTGINRIDADRDANLLKDLSAQPFGVAIIDTGIWLKHEDLYVAGGVGFVPYASSGNDDNGHGTHVAGTVGAIAYNGLGVRGVAPKVPLWAVKVLDRGGYGSVASVVAGVDWVTARAGTITVANMSLSMAGNSPALDEAIHNSVAAGVTYVVAAGNNGSDAAGYSPANHPDVITVSALADSDGICGGVGAATTDGADDSLAGFSNYGSNVALAAPGVSILSTYLGDAKKYRYGRYAILSGTSMATPHVTGAAAQYIAAHPGATPSAVKQALCSKGVPQGTLAGAATDLGPNPAILDGGWGGFRDSDSYAEPLLYVQNLNTN